MAKAELTVHIADLPRVKAALARLQAENERLREHQSVLDALHMSDCNEIARLRDALEAIHGLVSSWTFPSASSLSIESIARHALRSVAPVEEGTQ